MLTVQQNQYTISIYACFKIIVWCILYNDSEYKSKRRLQLIRKTKEKTQP